MTATHAEWKAYLEGQADLGTEEVVLAAPFVSRARVSNSTPENRAGSAPLRDAPGSYVGQSGRSRAAESVPGAPPEFNPAAFEPPPNNPGYSAAPTIGPDFFSAIAEKLAKPDARGRGASGAGKAAAPTPAPATAASLTATVPEFGDLEAYWTWLEAEYARLFPSAPKSVVRALGHPSPRLAVVELAPTAEGLFAGESGVLLDKMMNAIGLRREDLYLTAVMKTPPPGGAGKVWARKDVARMLPVLFRELKVAGCGLVLVLGETCAQAVLRTGRRISEITGTATEAEGLSLSATWHPDEIRKGESGAASAAPTTENARPLSREAWVHLQWLRGRLPARGS